MKLKRLVTGACILLVVAELLLVLVSWMLSASMTEDVRPLLSNEGVRWFFGSFTNFLSTPLLVFLLLLSMAWGCLSESGMLSGSPLRRSPDSQPRRARRFALITLLVYLFFVLALTVIPHAVLLSATGRLLPSPFSRALVAIVSFGIILTASVYGLVSRRFTSLSDVVSSLTSGISCAAPLFLLYVLLVQFIESLRFVFL